MEIYTEEQVRQAMQKAMIPSIYQMDLWGQLTHIEIPTDEEIDKKANKFKFELNKTFFKEGAKWILEQIKEQVDNGK